jgi:putative transposase
MALTLCIPDSDQGVQYAAQNYVDLLRKYTVQIRLAAQGKPEENGYAERLIRTIKKDDVDLSGYNNFTDVRSRTGRFLEDVYMTKRIQSSLGYLTPVEFETAWRLAHPEQTIS